MNQHKFLVGAGLLALALLGGGCSGMLPQTHSNSSSFQTFDEVRDAIESLVPMKSDVTTLTTLGIDPSKQPNTIILTHAEIVRRFVPSTVIKRENLDPGVLACLDAGDNCRGWEINAARLLRERNGNFLLDFTNFVRRTETSGWRFNATILLVNNVVVYRAWGGQPRVNELEQNTNPLGPLQDMGPAILTVR